MSNPIKTYINGKEDSRTPDEIIAGLKPGEQFFMSSALKERPITEHPTFNTPRNDWGVIPARHVEEYECPITGEVFPARDIPEDRSGYRPDLDGKALADFWDYMAGDWMTDDLPPGVPVGVTTFLAPVYWITTGEGAKARHQAPPIVPQPKPGTRTNNKTAHQPPKAD